MNIPNAITVARMALCPLIAYLALAPGAGSRYAAFAIFIAAALSDLWDGYLARKHGWISDLGKLLDPIADKLLMTSGFLPLYFITRRGGPLAEMPFFGALPLWVLLVVFGRELVVTLFRGYAVRRGIVIAAGRSGKYKALAQNVFIGAMFLWYPLLMSAAARQWEGDFWNGWLVFHSAVALAALGLAVLLTLLSLADYLWSYRAVVTGRR